MKDQELIPVLNRGDCEDQIIKRFHEMGKAACLATKKGNGFFVEGMGFVAFRKAAKLTGVQMYTAEPRQQRQAAWGEYAWITALNNQKRTIKNDK